VLAFVLAFGLVTGLFAAKAAVGRHPSLAALQYAVGAAPIALGLALLARSGRRRSPASV